MTAKIKPGTEPPEPGDVVTIERHGRTYSIHNPGGLIGRPLAAGRPYEARLLDEIHGLGLTGTAIDVGAHVGNHTLFLAEVCGLRVIAVEPDPRSFRMLLANLDLNPTVRVDAYRLAAGAGPGTGRLARGMTVDPDPDGDVPIRALDELVELPDLALVKVDVEGYEPAVLAGLGRHLTRSGPIVYAETHTRTADRATGAVLEPFGYHRTGEVSMGSKMVRWERA